MNNLLLLIIFAMGGLEMVMIVVFVIGCFLISGMREPEPDKPKDRDGYYGRDCPHCTELMDKDATVCPHWTRDVEPK